MENLKRKEQIAWKDLGDHVIILDSGESKMVHHLEEVSSQIWKLIDGTKSKETILNIILENYEVSQETLSNDFDEFIETLRENSLLQV